MLRITLAALHLLALGIGLGAVWARARTMRSQLDIQTVRRALTADAWWGSAAGIWIGTGVWRLLAQTEKTTRFYMDNHLFFTKMGLLALVLLLEIWPMIVLIGCRRSLSRGALAPETLSHRARTIATISYVEAVLVVLMVVAAVALARGYRSLGP